MALSIGVSVGSHITIGDHSLHVKTIAQPNLMVVVIDHGQEYLISSEQRVEVLPEVFVQVGVGQAGGGNRLAFEAPRAIRILRQEGKRTHEDRG